MSAAFRIAGACRSSMPRREPRSNSIRRLSIRRRGRPPHDARPDPAPDGGASTITRRFGVAFEDACPGCPVDPDIAVRLRCLEMAVDYVKVRGSGEPLEFARDFYAFATKGGRVPVTG